MKRFGLLWGVMALVAVACSSGEKVGDMTFDSVEKLTYDSVAVNEILKPSDWFALESSRAVVHSPRSEKLFYVYSLPEWNFLYSYGAKGEGPDDYRGSYVSLCDVNKDEFPVTSLAPGGIVERTLRVGESSIEVVGERKTGKNLTTDYMYREFTVNDSIYGLMWLPDWDWGTQDVSALKNFITTCDSRTNQHIDSLPMAEKIDYELSEDGMSVSGDIYNRAYIVYKHGKMYVFYDQLRRIDICDISPDGKITLEKTIGEPYTWEDVQAMDFKKEKGYKILSVDGGKRYKYIYVMTCDYQDMGSWQKVLNTYVEVWDYDGNKVKKYDMGRNFNRVMVDEVNEYFYFHHTGYDFEWVFRYKYDL